MITAARLVVLSIVAATVVFCIVQDRLTAAGARHYVQLQQAAIAGGGPAVTIDGIMRPAVRRSVRDALLSSAGVMAVGCAGAALIARRDRRG
jgi:hypothetical protein